jgi:hypothetical protein
VNLWTVGYADPRLTAPARSPMDKPGKTLCVSPTLPTGRRLPHKLPSTPQQHGMILISGNGEISSRRPAFSLFFPGSCPNNRDRRTSACDAVIRDLRNHFQDYTKANGTVFAALADRLEDARRHAERLKRHNAETRSENPATNMHILVEYLRNLKK